MRFEDLQFHAKEMINLVCECAGAVPRDPNGEFTYIVDSGKWGPGHRGKQVCEFDLTFFCMTTTLFYIL